MATPNAADPVDAWPRHLNRGLLIGAATIVLLSLLGGVLAQAPDLQESNALHLQLEYFAVFAAVSIFFLSSAKYAISRERVYLPLSLGFLGAAIFDLIHPLVPHGPIPASTAGGFEVLLQDLNGYLWWMSRISFGIGFLGAALAFRQRFLDDLPNRMLVRGLLWTFAEIVFLVALVVLLPLPAYYGATGISQILELLPILLYMAAAYVIIRTPSGVDRGMRIGGLASLGLASITQVFASTSTVAGDALFFVAHAFKITSYLVVLFGLYLEHVRLYAEERKLRQNVEQAEREALRRRAELFAVIENTADGIAILDGQGRVLHLNRAAQRMLVVRDPQNWNGTYLAEHLSTAARQTIEPALQQCLRDGVDMRDIEIGTDAKTSEVLSVGLVPLKDAGGLVQGAVADFHNITTLRQAERRYRELTEGAPDGIVELDGDGRIAFFNRAAERIFGYTKDEVAGRDISLFLTDGVLGPESRARIFEVAGPKLAPLELVARRKDGRRTVVELTLSQSTFEAERRVTAVVRDVQQLQKTRREKAGLVAVAEAVNSSQDAKALCAEAAKALRGALDYEGLGIYLRDPKTPLLTMAGASYPKHENVPAEFATVKLEPSDGSRVARAFLERRPQWVEARAGIQASTAKGTLLPVRDDSLGIAVPVFVGDDVVAVLAALTSTTKHTVEEELPVLQSVALHLALGMGQKLLFEELQDTAKNLAVTNRELDAFIYTASHDLAEPLRSMSNFSQFLMEDYAAKLDPQANDYLRRIHEGALRMRALLDALLQVSRIRHKPLPFEKVDMVKALGEVRESLDAMIRDRKGEVVVHKPMPRVWGQPSRVMEVFTNLVSNGLKFNESPVPRVDISASMRDGFVEFSVKDNGIGIPLKYQDRVFGLFTRLHPRNQYPGTGAGLAIVRTIVEQHGGQIRIDSKEDAGTTVVFTLPQEPSA